MRYIYITTNLVNNKKYIGQRKLQPNKNPETDNYFGSGTLLLKAVKKYGKHNFTKEILHKCNTQEKADKLETLEITKHNAVDSDEYYNILSGGQFGRSEKHSSETSKYMKEYYSNDYNYTCLALKKNRDRYLRGLNPITNTIHQRDIKRLKNTIIASNMKRNRIEKNKVLKLIRKANKVYISSERRIEIAKASWSNKEDKLIAIRKGQAKRTQMLRDTNDVHIKPEVCKELSRIRLTKSHNYIGLYLLDNGVSKIANIRKSIQNLYTRVYKDEANMYKQMDNVMSKMMSEYGVAIDREYMIELTLQGRRAKSLTIN